MSPEQLTKSMLPAVELELRRQIERLAQAGTREFHSMLAYHMGWSGRGRAGKRIRPLLTLLASASTGGRWQQALPAAAALELVHNFSLVHDDIQDNSPTRRGRPTLWKKYGLALAVNAGDALFAIAFQALLDLKKSFPPATVIKAAAILQQACLDLTRGQFLDLHHQDQRGLSLRDYWRMIEGKTAALIGACTEMGAILGGAGDQASQRYRDFGRALGMAFQVQDDLLGIWGAELQTGKSATGDLAEGKLSLPVLYGVSKDGRFARLWRSSNDRARDAAQLRVFLEQEGAHEYASRHARRLTDTALETLRSLRPRGRAGEALTQLTARLLKRQA